MNWYVDVLKNYAGFSGRARRKEFWMFSLIHLVVAAVLFGLGLAIDTTIPYFIYVVATFVPSLAVLVRRLHDTDRSGWWFLISFVPLVGGIVLLVFLASEGKPEQNEHGANPKLAPQTV